VLQNAFTLVRWQQFLHVCIQSVRVRVLQRAIFSRTQPLAQ
jgi:hypothetical protein